MYVPDTITPVVEQLGQPGFSRALLEMLRDTAPFESAIILAYPSEGRLSVVDDELHDETQAGYFDSYVQGLFVLSPLYIQSMQGRRGFFHLPDIAPQDFADSEFYELYYSSSGILDHTGYLLESGDGSPLAISLERGSGLPAYTQEEKMRLNALAPLLAALARQNWQAPPKETGNRNLQEHVELLLQQFGSSVLSPREREVVQLVLRGFPSKTVARELGISAHTEQVHRKNIYQKLTLNSHNELFSLFIDLLGQPFDGVGDPIDALRPSGVKQ